jgi:hypothetical protein
MAGTYKRRGRPARMAPEDRLVILTATVTPEQRSRLWQVAEQRGVPMAQVLREVLDEWAAREEPLLA